MLEAVAAAQILLLALVGLVVVALAQQETQHHRPYLGLQIRAVAVVEMAVLLHHFCQEQAVQVSSSSRPINNEDKWKPKSIGCMESTPQCTF
jgi:hypothetical protein